MPRLRGSFGCRRGHLLASWIVRLRLSTQVRANRPVIYSASSRTELRFGLSTGFRPLHQLRHADAQALGQPDHVVEARITAAVLDVADPRLNKAGGFSYLYLAQAAFVSDGANSPPQGLGIRRGGGHRSQDSPSDGSNPCPSSTSGSKPSRSAMRSTLLSVKLRSPRSMPPI